MGSGFQGAQETLLVARLQGVFAELACFGEVLRLQVSARYLQLITFNEVYCSCHLKDII